MKKMLLVLLAMLCAATGSALAANVPAPNYSVDVTLGGGSLSPDQTKITAYPQNIFTILEQPDGVGDYISNDWPDFYNYEFKADLMGQLPILKNNNIMPTTAFWTITSTPAGWGNTTVLWGSYADLNINYGTGVLTATLLASPFAYYMDGTTQMLLPGAYQGFQQGGEANGVLYYPAYALTYDTTTNTGSLIAIPEPATMSLLLCGALGFIRRQTR